MNIVQHIIEHYFAQCTICTGCNKTFAGKRTLQACKKPENSTSEAFNKLMKLQGRAADGAYEPKHTNHDIRKEKKDKIYLNSNQKDHQQ